jgi:hypothetical protein
MFERESVTNPLMMEQKVGDDYLPTNATRGDNWFKGGRRGGGMPERQIPTGFLQERIWDKDLRISRHYRIAEHCNIYHWEIECKVDGRVRKEEIGLKD